MPLGCNCCTERPCCGNRLFRGPGSVDPLTLSLESRQTWRALTTGCSPVLSPAPVVTSLGSENITLTYQSEIPSAFLSGLDAGSAAFVSGSNGWYVSSTVNLFQIAGDPLWTGTVDTVAGKYFYAVADDAGTLCLLGFWFDSDQTLGTYPPSFPTACGVARWQYYIGRRPLYYSGGSPAGGVFLNHENGSQQNVPRLLFQAGSSTRAIGIFGIGDEYQELYTTQPVRDCSPVIYEHEGLYDYDVPLTVPKSTGVPVCGGTITPGVYPSRIRQAQTFVSTTCSETNPLNTSLSVGSGTPPTALAALSGTHAVYEQLSLWVTISE